MKALIFLATVICVVAIVMFMMIMFLLQGLANFLAFAVGSAMNFVDRINGKVREDWREALNPRKCKCRQRT